MEACALMKSWPSSFRLDSWEKTRSLLKNRFLGVAKKCNVFQLHCPVPGQSSNRQFLVHVVKRGETLTYISKQYGVSVYAIAAANLDIVDVDLVLEGQCINIPISSQGTQMDLKQSISCAEDRCKGFFNNQLLPKSQRFFSTVLSYYHIQLAKPSGRLLILSPIIAFCIGCIIKVFQRKVSEMLKQQSVKKGHAPSGQRSTRWRAVIYDSPVSDTADAESREEPGISSEEDRSVASFEDISRAYTKLEPAYLKFLSDCGMSKWGYWRGGSQE